MQCRQVCAAVMFYFLFSVSAQAKGLFIINTGEEFFEVSNFPAKVVEEYPMTEGLKVAYKCSRFGVLWADVWTWDCSRVGIQSVDDSSYHEIPAEMDQVLASDPTYSERNMKRGGWNHYGFWALLLGFIAFSSFGYLSKDS
ncbi:MAG: hypothetical protein RLY58_784 [Pseudomonadota bacterium]|jgi:hypothetical protein